MTASSFVALCHSKPLSEVAFAAGVSKSAAHRLAKGGPIARDLDFVALADLFEVDLATLLLIVQSDYRARLVRGGFLPKSVPHERNGVAA